MLSGIEIAVMCMVKLQARAKMGRLKAIVVLVVLAFIVSACQGARSADDGIDLTTQQVTGSWHSNAEGGTIVFSADGRMRATDLINEIFDDQHQSGERHSGDGTWTIFTSVGNPNGPRNTVQLLFQTLSGARPGFATEMRAEKQGNGIVLVFYIGDPDLGSRYVFSRQSEQAS
jgi:hypothetical protein